MPAPRSGLLCSSRLTHHAARARNVKLYVGYSSVPSISSCSQIASLQDPSVHLWTTSCTIFSLVLESLKCWRAGVASLEAWRVLWLRTDSSFSMCPAWTLNSLQLIGVTYWVTCYSVVILDRRTQILSGVAGENNTLVINFAFQWVKKCIYFITHVVTYILNSSFVKIFSSLKSDRYFT